VKKKRVLLDDIMDQKFKPGLYRQVQNFLSGDLQDFCTIKNHAENLKFYFQMANYNEIP